MTAEQKEIRDQDLADAVHEAVRQLREAVRIAKKCGLKVRLSIDRLELRDGELETQIKTTVRREF